MSLSETATQWVQPGQEVVVIHGRHMQPSPVLTIDRVGKRDVVLSNGDRYSIKRLAPTGDHISKPGRDVWSGHNALFPADHPRVERARREQSEREGIERIRALAHKVDDAVRVGDWTDAHRAVTTLAPLLAERADDGSSGGAG